jgi:SAM-dependent methyltransferase
MYRKFEEGCDIVAASRFMRGGCMKGCPFPKAFFVRAASFTLHWLAGVPVHDASSGFRLFSRRVIDRLWIESREGFTYSIELLVKCRRLGWKIGEVPALWFERTRGRSRFRVWRWLPHYLVWYRYAFATAYLRRPPSTVRLRGMERSSAQDKDAEKKFFDQFGGERPYDVFTDGGYARITDEFLKHFDPKPGLVVADLGCGTGAFTAKFAGFGLRLFGVDISPQCIASARRQHPGITFEVGDIEKTHYSNETFDAIFLSGVLHHLKDLAGVFRECHRILKRDGVLLGYDPHRRNPFMSAFRCKHSPLYIARGLTENERPLSREEILGALARSGFTRVSVYSISGVTYKYIDSDWSFISLPVYNCIERIFDLFGPIRSRFGSFLITCARKGAA